MPIHFPVEELADRRTRTAAAMGDRGLDALVLFRQESMYWLTGYDTFGYVFFQVMLLTPDGQTVLITRAPDLRQARFTSVVEDIRIWRDEAGADPVSMLVALLKEKGLVRRRIGVEWDAYGLTAKRGFEVAAALDGLVAATDASDLVSRLRMVKSPAEIAYVRRAAELADLAYDAALREVRPGAFEGDILAAMQGAIWRGGGDDPANEQIIGSGPGALMCRYFTGRRHLDADDQLTLEFAGVYRHYHACLMRTIRLGEPPPRQRAMHEAAVASLAAAEAALKPGRPIGEVFDAHARVLDAAGFQPHRMNACGYSLGATYAPNWMDSADISMFFHGNPTVAEPGQIFFIHIIVYDSDAGLAMTSGRTVLVTETGVEPLTRASTDLVVR